MRAMEIMRAFSRDNVPFSFAYYSFNDSEKNSQGIKREKNVLLAQGYRRNQSSKSEILASFLRLDTGERRQFYIPLILELNGMKVKQQ